MNRLEILSGNGAETSAEFKVYSEIIDDFNGVIVKGNLILEPVNNANSGINIFLTEKGYNKSTLIYLKRNPVTADNPIVIPLYYKESEKIFYLEDNTANAITEIIGLICYDLGIGEFNAESTSWECDLHDNAKDYPYTYFSEINTIFLNKSELAEIKDFNVVLNFNDGIISVTDLIKFERVKPKLSAPDELIKGANYEEADFKYVELYAAAVPGGDDSG